jgi:glycine/D-amino acid oxidase-like deaminating enzyme
VHLFEQWTVAAGASGRTGALLRRHYTNEAEARLAHIGNQVYRNWPEIVGGDCGFVPAGIIVTIESGPGFEQNLERLRLNVAMQNRLGINSRVVEREELRQLEPFAFVDDIQSASYEPDSGYCDSIAASQSMATAAQQAGAVLHEGVTADSIETLAGHVSGIRTSRGSWSADIIICAAGPWSPKLTATAGVHLPLTTLRVQIIIAQRPIIMARDHLVFIDTASGMFTRPWGPGRSLIGIAGGEQHDEVDPDSYEIRNDPDYPARAIGAATRRFPMMERASYLHGHACLYDLSPDSHPIIGPTEVGGLYVATGFSGAGFKKAPAVGKCLADLVMNVQTSAVDLRPFFLARFDSIDWKRRWSETEYEFRTDFGHGF